jgi:predicted aconitase
LFSEYHLDSSETVAIPRVKAPACTILQPMDPKLWQLQGVTPETHSFSAGLEKYCNRLGINPTYTCAPYLVGYVPVKGEHCAWMESSAVPICNSVFGGRTNTEGYESAGAAMLTGKIPNWGYHLDENRYGHYLVKLEYEVESPVDWGLLGFHTGRIVQERIPVFNGVKHRPDLRRLMYCAAASASSGGVEMFHVVGVTPEALSLEMAFGTNKPMDTLKFGHEERRSTYELLQSARDSNVDFVVLGCPHYALDQIRQVAWFLEGKRLHTNTAYGYSLREPSRRWPIVPDTQKQLKNPARI